MADDYGIVDTLMNLPGKPGQPASDDPNIQRWFHRSKVLMEGATIEEMLADLDAVRVEHGLLTKMGVPRTEDEFRAAAEGIAEACAASNGRLHGFLLFDVRDLVDGVRWLEASVREYGFVTAHIMPSSVGLPPNHAFYYPFYVKCVELGIPIRINVGFPGPMRPAEPQRPVYLDEICLNFPELLVVGSHVGHPWHLEVVALLQKHPNFRLMTGGFAPKYVPDEIWQVANTRASHKVMWGSDYPLLPLERAAAEGREVPLKDEARRRYLRDNALEVFKIG